MRERGFEGLVELASRLPWPVGVGFAIVSYVMLTLLSKHILATPPATLHGDLAAPAAHSLYGILAGVGRWLISAIFVLGAATSWWRRRHRTELLDAVGADSRKLEALSWRDFERLIGEAFRQQGYTVEELGGRGPDGGVDLLLRREDRETLVQCKQWRSQRVGVTTVRELRGVMAQRGAAGVIVTLDGFTREAEAFAQESGIQLLDRKAVQALVMRSLPAPLVDTAPPGLAEAKVCPECGSSMVRRIARQGRHAGEAFFGCSRYPECRGIVVS
jgi:restriction system protein